MFWTYAGFQAKLMMKNKKNWFTGLALMLYFPLFFYLSTETDYESLEEQKRAEQTEQGEIANSFTGEQHGSPERERVYEIYNEQSTLVNYQVFYITRGHYDDFIEAGIELNELRLEAHELDNEGVPDHLVMPVEEILKEQEYLTYLQEHSMPLDPAPGAGAQYTVYALNTLSGFLFFFAVLLAGSELLTSEKRHGTVMRGLPLSFMKKLAAKISLHFIQLFIFLVAGVFLGFAVAARENGTGSLAYPVLIYRNGAFEAVPASYYIILALAAMGTGILLVLMLSAVLNLLLKNEYATLLAGTGLYFVPGIFAAAGITASFFHALAFTDFEAVVTGDTAQALMNPQLDTGQALLWMLVLAAVLTIIMMARIKLPFLSQGDKADGERT